MSYSILGQDLHETADKAKQYFASKYGANHFVCEAAVDAQLPMKPTWQAALSSGYKLCIEVRQTPFSQTLYGFVTECANKNMPIRLWVAVPKRNAAPEFNSELKRARDIGIGVVEVEENGTGHEFHKPVPLSLFGLRRTDMGAIPKSRRDEVKAAEDSFLGGAPEQGCQEICQILEQLTRKFGEYTYMNGYWKTPIGAKKHDIKFFAHGSWQQMLEELDARIDDKRVRVKYPTFSKAKIAGARAYTDWRNSMSHKPRTLEQRKARDSDLRTMYEATRNLVIDWYKIAKAYKLLT